MQESSERAIQIGVNIFIFIIALTIAINLMTALNNVISKAFELGTSIPTGSRVLVVNKEEKRAVKGYDLVSYYANYISNDKQQKSGRYQVIIENKSGVVKISSDDKASNKKIVDHLKEKVTLTSQYELTIDKYDTQSKIIIIKLKEV